MRRAAKKFRRSGGCVEEITEIEKLARQTLASLAKLAP